MLDLASVLQFLRLPLPGKALPDSPYEVLRDALLDGYALHGRLGADAPAQVEAWIMARHFVTLNWMLDDWPRLDTRPWGPAYLRALPRLWRAWGARGA